MNKIFLAFCLSIAIISCGKDESSDSTAVSTTASLTLLQNTWIIDSLYVYPPSGMSSAFIYAIKADNQYADFRADGKVYSYGGAPVASFDTSAYKMLPDNKTFIAYTISGGATSTVADTGYILKLTPNSFVYYSLNGAREYGKWVLKR